MIVMVYDSLRICELVGLLTFLLFYSHFSNTVWEILSHLVWIVSNGEEVLPGLLPSISTMSSV